MQSIEIGLNDIKNNLVRNKKRIIIIFVLIVLAGAVWGYIDMRLYKQEHYTVEDTAVQKIDLEHLPKDEAYYYSAFMELKEKSCGLNAYIQYLKQVNLSGESMKKVSDLEALSMEEQRTAMKVREFYVSEKPIICENPDDTETFIKEKLEASKLRLKKAEGMLEELGDKAEKKDMKKKLYAEQDIAIWEDYQEWVKSIDSAEIRKVNSRMDLFLEEWMQSINSLTDQFNSLIAEIEAEEQYEIIYNPYLLREYSSMAGITGELDEEDAVNVKKTGALIYARSIAGVDSREERFYAVLTFSIILGAACSLLYGGLRNRKLC